MKITSLLALITILGHTTDLKSKSLKKRRAANYLTLTINDLQYGQINGLYSQSQDKV